MVDLADQGKQVVIVVAVLVVHTTGVTLAVPMTVVGNQALVQLLVQSARAVILRLVVQAVDPLLPPPLHRSRLVLQAPLLLLLSARFLMRPLIFLFLFQILLLPFFGMVLLEQQDML